MEDYFDCIEVVLMNDVWRHTSLRDMVKFDRPKYYKMTVLKPSKYKISIYQESK